MTTFYIENVLSKREYWNRGCQLLSLTCSENYTQSNTQKPCNTNLCIVIVKQNFVKFSFNMLQFLHGAITAVFTSAWYKFHNFNS